MSEQAQGQQGGGFIGWLESISPGVLVLGATLLALAPWPVGAPQPHLIEKIGMLMSGTLHRPIDIFDLFMHGTPALLAIARLGLLGYRRVQVAQQ